MICAGVILFNAFSVSLLKLDLEMQRDFIAEVFCINKEKPEMSCHGQCFIENELQKESKKQKESSESIEKEVILEVQYKDELVFTKPNLFVEKQPTKIAFSNRLSSVDEANRLFRPPIV